jgi:hypothetical protein
MGLKYGAQQPGFDFAQPTGFLRKYFNPVSGRRAIAWDQETGFLNKYFGGDAKVVVETRFLGDDQSSRKNWLIWLQNRQISFCWTDGQGF